jgi:mannose-6-phosphate isomerase-like protein (cupin superfamily)
MNAPLANTWFDNAQMGQRTRLVTLPFETGGRSFVREYVNRPQMGKFAIPEHFHPTWTETFEILRGHAHYRIGREEREAGPGERVILPPRISHLHPWSASDEELHVRHTAVADPPDLRGLTASLQGILTIFALAGHGRVNRRGQPTLLQLAVIARATMPATYLPGLPPPIQHALIGALAALGRLAGYRVTYPGFPVVPGSPTESLIVPQ